MLHVGEPSKVVLKFGERRLYPGGEEKKKKERGGRFYYFKLQMIDLISSVTNSGGDDSQTAFHSVSDCFMTASIKNVYCDLSV